MDFLISMKSGGKTYPHTTQGRVAGAAKHVSRRGAGTVVMVPGCQLGQAARGERV